MLVNKFVLRVLKNLYVLCEVTVDDPFFMFTSISARLAQVIVDKDYCFDDDRIEILMKHIQQFIDVCTFNHNRSDEVSSDA